MQCMARENLKICFHISDTERLREREEIEELNHEYYHQQLTYWTKCDEPNGNNGRKSSGSIYHSLAGLVKSETKLGQIRKETSTSLISDLSYARKSITSILQSSFERKLSHLPQLRSAFGHYARNRCIVS